MAAPAPGVQYLTASAPTTAIGSATTVYDCPDNFAAVGLTLTAKNGNASTRTLAVYVSLPADHSVRVQLGPTYSLLSGESLGPLRLPNLSADQRLYLVASGADVYAAIDGIVVSA